MFPRSPLSPSSRGSGLVGGLMGFRDRSPITCVSGQWGHAGSEWITLGHRWSGCPVGFSHSLPPSRRLFPPPLPCSLSSPSPSVPSPSHPSLPPGGSSYFLLPSALFHPLISLPLCRLFPPCLPVSFILSCVPSFFSYLTASLPHSSSMSSLPHSSASLLRSLFTLSILFFSTPSYLPFLFPSIPPPSSPLFLSSGKQPMSIRL